MIERLKSFLFSKFADHGSLPFRALRRGYRTMYEFTGRSESRHFRRTRRYLLRNPAVKGYFTTADHTFIEFVDGTRFVWDPVDPCDLLGPTIKAGDMFEADETLVCAKLIEPGNTVFDIGANFGWHTVHFARALRSQGRVHAFEPLPNVHDKLKLHLHVNGLEDMVVVENRALAEEEGELQMYIPRHSGPVFATLNPDYWKDGGSAEIVKAQVTTLDHYVARLKLTRLDFIKCDVEGAEWRVLLGAAKCLAELRPMLMLEINRAPENEQQDVVKFLAPWDYRPYYYADGRLQRFDGRADQLPAHNFFFLTPAHIKAISARITVAA